MFVLHTWTYQSMAAIVIPQYYPIQFVSRVFQYPFLDCILYPRPIERWKTHVSYDPIHHWTIFDTHLHRSHPTYSPIYHSQLQHQNVNTVYTLVGFDVPSVDVISVHYDLDYQIYAFVSYWMQDQSK